ncbi:hypothetical protein LD85_2739 [Saccharolobus islandicus L.D.8.5]|uniref:Uncharacterized protein n=1 Tax=Saccharolobus islandicus (strain L.D.8.5 / Lassen \|nr:hypothetical protein LD85_2739 [Sulfolobus islandicus L.D.8.5]
MIKGWNSITDKILIISLSIRINAYSKLKENWSRLNSIDKHLNI